MSRKQVELTFTRLRFDGDASPSDYNYLAEAALREALREMGDEGLAPSCRLTTEIYVANTWVKCVVDNETELPDEESAEEFEARTHGKAGTRPRYLGPAGRLTLVQTGGEFRLHQGETE